MSYSKGFTLVEMVVVVAIFIITTGIILANLPNFRDKSSLDLLAQEVATTIRQAQVYGSGVRALNESKFPRAYGLSFQGDEKASFVFFADLIPPSETEGNWKNDAGADCEGDECVELFRLTNNVSISEISTCKGACTSLSGTAGLNILFPRPSSDAKFTDKDGNDLSCDYAKIVLTNKNGANQRQVKIWNTGHIYVE